MTAILVSLLLLAELACVGTLRAQLKEDEVNFEYMAKITMEKGNNQCLWNLAKEYYKNPLEWTYIKEMNNIPNEKTIPIGTVIYIPVKDAKKIVKKADVKIEEMNATEKALRDEIANLKAELERCKEDNKKCEAEREKLANALRECEGKVRRLTKALEDCEASVKKKDATIAELQAMLENVKKALDKMKADSDLLAQESEMRAAAQRKRSEDIESLEAKLRQCRREVEELEAERNRLRAQIAQLEQAAMMKPAKPEKKTADEKSMVAAIAIMLIGSIIWIASD
jgi:DNA repair exonuclease SbcCD ATPase subunit